MMVSLRRILRSRWFMDYGMVLVLILICAFLAVKTMEPGPAIPGEEGARAFLKRVNALKAKSQGQALLIAPTPEQLAQRAADPPLSPEGEPLGLLDVDTVLQEIGAGKVFAEAVDYDAQRADLSRALRAILRENPDITVVAYVDQTHDRIAGIVATQATALKRTVLVAGPPRSTVSVFLRKRNLINIARQISVFAIIAVGMTMVILTGGIDLSVGSLVAFFGVVTALTINRPDGIPWWGWSVTGVVLVPILFMGLSRIRALPLPGLGGARQQWITGCIVGLVLGAGLGMTCSGSIVGIQVDVEATAERIVADAGDEILALYVTDCEENRRTAEALDQIHPASIKGVYIDASGLSSLGRRTQVRDSLKRLLENYPQVKTIVALDHVAFRLADEVAVGSNLHIVQSTWHAFGILLFAVLLTAVLGMATGAFTGTVINAFRIPPFIATLALMQIARGLAYTFSEGRAIPVAYDQFTEMIGRGFVLESWFGELLPVPVLMMAIAYFLAYLLLGYTPFGRYIYAVGGNEHATHLSGIPVGAVRFGAYVITGLMSAFVGVIVASKLGSGDPNSGQLYELYVIAACVVGGTSLLGGEGKILGTLIGALLLGVLNNGLTLLKVDTYLQMVIIGAVILIAVLLDQMKKRL